MRISRIALAPFLLLLLAGVAPAGESVQCNAATPGSTTSLAGPWWFKLQGKDRGALLLEFTQPKGGTFEIADIALNGKPSFGFSSVIGDFFTIDAGQPLGFDSKGNVTGTLALGPDAELTFEKGKPNKDFSKLKLRGTLSCATCETPVVVKLIGRRPPAGFPVLTGGTESAGLKGKGMKSKALTLEVNGDTPFGLPAYSWTAAGPAEIDKEEDDFESEGQIMLDPSFHAFGLADGANLANGKLSVADPNTPIPKLGLVVQGDPKFKLKGKLTQAVQPILLVTPTTYDFGAVPLDDPNTPTFSFTVTNVGTGSLSGAVTFLGAHDDFELTGDQSYEDIEPGGDQASIDVSFDPQLAGAKTASVCFGVDGGAGSVAVPLKGVGGIAQLTIDPDPIVFDDTLADPNGATAVTITATVTNSGDTRVVGQVSLSPTTQFALMKGLLPAVNPIGYDLAPGAETSITVRFNPTVVGTPTATLTFTGVTNPTTGDTTGTQTVSVSGNAVSSTQ